MDVRLKPKFEAEQWVGSNTAEIVDWIRRGGTASIRWYPDYDDEKGAPVPDWMRIPEHLIIVDQRRIHTVVPFAWILRDEGGYYRVISDAEFRSEFEQIS